VLVNVCSRAETIEKGLMIGELRPNANLTWTERDRVQLPLS